jgi:hypothetical protein
MIRRKKRCKLTHTALLGKLAPTPPVFGLYMLLFIGSGPGAHAGGGAIMAMYENNKNTSRYPMHIPLSFKYSNNIFGCGEWCYPAGQFVSLDKLSFKKINF